MIWIKANERLPEEYEDVLLYSPHDTPSVGYLGEGGIWYALYNNMHDYSVYIEIKNAKITHWMPLPEKPQVAISMKTENKDKIKRLRMFFKISCAAFDFCIAISEEAESDNNFNRMRNLHLKAKDELSKIVPDLKKIDILLAEMGRATDE